MENIGFPTENISITVSTYDYLRKNIIFGKIKPGQKLNEYKLSKKLNVSRPPLREAFRLLEKDGLVINIPRKGVIVSELSVRDFEETSQIREMCECYAIDLLKTTNSTDLSQLISALDSASALNVPLNTVEAETSFKYIENHLDFHKNLVVSAANSQLNSIYNLVSLKLIRYQFIYFQSAHTDQYSLEYHERILEYLKKREYEQAKEELKRHIDHIVQLVRNIIVNETNSLE
ncbi:GntR family transcriptional regulator [Candidatus Contubernalis alkaliaceticus]|uniref:GntR family transcriptional regulator n=1 Tax=Candidatus Contubernalis alkaliaceticus TaxID=338645 RepID=UPI001F4C4924|nr:GntR family transcriptional regulator [Candidatus Contubernalis alkalaceticus]UNC92917.1 GntR family transcriptional regulator [Candidatus Contubernalis alkalaceticus]